MVTYCFAANSFEGNIVRVEVEIRRGIPGVDIIGLPDGAVLESKERFRAAMRNSGYEIAKGRILINLSPAGIRKIGASFDLAIATAVIIQSGIIEEVPECKTMVIGELMLSGEIRAVNGVLSAVSAAVTNGIKNIIVPKENLQEALSFGEGRIFGIDKITSLKDILLKIKNNKIINLKTNFNTIEDNFVVDVDFADIRGLTFVKRALEVAAAGRHNVLLFGPPGGGKTISARAMGGILPSLSRKESIEVTRIYSMAGMLGTGKGLIKRPPFRQPHHSASEEGLIGGGKLIKPGEVSLAHCGVLFLDETPEFSKHMLQALREPVEEGRVDIARAGRSCIYPADFQLILAANPCPCGNLGKKDAVCVCSRKEVINYWKRLGGALIDRIDIRVPVEPVPISPMSENAEDSESIRHRVSEAAMIQEKRFKNEIYNRNSCITQGHLKKYCKMDEDVESLFIEAVTKMRISSRACLSILKIARTIADIRLSEKIEKNDIFEALQHRRYGESDFFWDKL